MKNEMIQEQVIKHLKLHYWGNIAFLAILFLIILFKVLPFFNEPQPLSVTIERYAIVVTIIAIPAALKLFSNLLKKVPENESFKTKTDKYRSASYLRLYTISAITLLNIILFGYSRNMNFMWFVVVLFIVFMFCRPSYPELDNLVNNENLTSANQDNGETA